MASHQDWLSALAGIAVASSVGCHAVQRCQQPVCYSQHGVAASAVSSSQPVLGVPAARIYDESHMSGQIEIIPPTPAAGDGPLPPVPVPPRVDYQESSKPVAPLPPGGAAPQFRQPDALPLPPAEPGNRCPYAQ